MNVLVIDDFKMMVDIVSIVCEKHGQHDIKTASSIEEAETILQQGFKPDLVFSDYNLPNGRKGPSFFPKIREANPSVYIVLMTSMDLMDVPAGHGADGIFKKTREPIIRIKVALDMATERLACI